MRPGERVVAGELGPGVVVKDEAADDGGFWQPPRDRVWVRLDAGENPVPFSRAELQSLGGGA